MHCLTNVDEAALALACVAQEGTRRGRGMGEIRRELECKSSAQEGGGGGG